MGITFSDTDGPCTQLAFDWSIQLLTANGWEERQVSGQAHTVEGAELPSREAERSDLRAAERNHPAMQESGNHPRGHSLAWVWGNRDEIQI